MGLRFRKSIRVGKYFRINISKSGIGYSFGVPGARLTYSANGRVTSTVGIPGTGISYTTSHNRSTTSHRNTTTVPQAQTQGVGLAVSTERANISDFQPAEMVDLLKTIKIAKNINTSGVILLILGLLLLIAFSQINVAFMVSSIVGTALGTALIILAHTKLPARLEYEMEDYFKELHAKRLEAWGKFFSCSANWQTITSAYVTNRKINAGASALVKRVKVRLKKRTPFYIKTDVELIRLDLNGEKILILPDKLIVIKNFGVGAIDYQDVKISTYKQGFIEDGIVPRDAQIINYTWRYVNKNGTPDKRFNNNRKLPICSYGYVSITSSSGLDITLSCSNNQNIDKLFALARTVPPIQTPRTVPHPHANNQKNPKSTPYFGNLVGAIIFGGLFLFSVIAFWTLIIDKNTRIVSIPFGVIAVAFAIGMVSMIIKAKKKTDTSSSAVLNNAPVPIQQQVIEIIKAKYPNVECTYTQENGIYSFIIPDHGILRISNSRQIKCDYRGANGSITFFGDINRIQELI